MIAEELDGIRLYGINRESQAVAAASMCHKQWTLVSPLVTGKQQLMAILSLKRKTPRGIFCSKRPFNTGRCITIKGCITCKYSPIDLEEGFSEILSKGSNGF